MIRAILTFLDAIKFQHTVFALPFAVMSMVLAARSTPDGLTLDKLIWILVCMVSARTAAMAFNRFADVPFDRLNPRTKNWPTVDGRLSRRVMIVAAAAALVVFFVAAAMLAPVCLALAPIAAVVLLGYSYAKRFTWLSHAWLGVTLAIAPVGAWIAVRGRIENMETPAELALLVTVWVAGFDLLYACWDVEFDRAQGLASFPARFGLRATLAASAALHFLAAVALFAFVFRAGLGPLSYAAAGAASLLLLYEHRIVRPNDLSRLSAAFFSVNGVVSLLLMVLVVWDAVR